MRRLPLELIERLRALRPTADRPQDHVGFVATAAGVYFLIASAIEVWRFLVADILLPVWRVLQPWVWGVALAILVAGLSPRPVAAMEAWCAANSANCVCHNDMQATSWTSLGSGFYAKEPPDADSKTCYNASSGRAQFWTTGSAPVVVSGLNGHTAARLDGVAVVEALLGGGSNQLQPGMAGHRVGGRYYINLGAGYQSTDPDWATSGGCSNDKYVQIGTSGTQDYLTAYTTGFLYGLDGSPQFTPTNWTPASRIGHWVRIELYTTYTSVRQDDIYMTDLTTGQTITRLNATPPNSSFPFDLMQILHRYRAGPCAGTYDVAYVVGAHWATDAGQTIGAATEMEGAAASRGFILRIMIPLLIALGLSVWRESVSL